mmetsp:Transcript_3175/g.4224  ORF Transcript_3175/g.4224 Transcript_3175/m.4224 type:complete len:210 (+) Transcript_3175:140-769(+)
MLDNKLNSSEPSSRFNKAQQQKQKLIVLQEQLQHLQQQRQRQQHQNQQPKTTQTPHENFEGVSFTCDLNDDERDDWSDLSDAEEEKYDNLDDKSHTKKLYCLTQIFSSDSEDLVGLDDNNSNRSVAHSFYQNIFSQSSRNTDVSENKAVQFLPGDVSEVRMVPKPKTEDLSKLYFSVHEVQRSQIEVLEEQKSCCSVNELFRSVIMHEY